MSHSKRNTSLAFFTAHERAELRGTWGSQQTRLSRDSFLAFGACRLCLLQARDPVSCPTHGHLFCKECALNSLLSQKKETKRLQREWEARREEDEELKRREQGQDDQKRLEEFELVQAGLEVKLGSKGRRIIGREGGKVVVEEEESKGTKRKFSVDQDELVQAGKEKVDVRRKLEDGKQSLPSFWVPSETPSTKVALTAKPPKATPTCPASSPDKPHEMSLKSMIDVSFAEEQDSTTKETVRSCPSCRKALSNSTKAVLAKPCGHVVCKPCAAKFLKPSEKDAHDKDAEVGIVRCYVCQADLTARKKKDGKDGKTEMLVEIASDGTGFAGGGSNMIKRAGVSFQC